jgi:hypothetical protein
MTTCTCDTHTSTTTATALTVSNTGGGQAVSISGSSTGTPLCALYLSGNNSTYGFFSEGTANAILGKSYANNGKGVFGQSSCSTGGYGVYGQAVTIGGHGVHGENTNAGHGVYGTSNGFAGVYGISMPNGGYGVMGVGNIGVYATTGGSGGIYGLYVSQGEAYVSGYLTKAGGGYRIDHPADPDNKFLNHCFVESPEMLNLYRGRATFDAKGEAIVSLPSYFDVANESPEYILTPLGASMPGMFIAQEIVNGLFKVSGGIAGKSFSWQVSAARADKWAKANHPGVEIEKKLEDKGLFMHPELHGHSDSKSIDPIRRGK